MCAWGVYWRTWSSSLSCVECVYSYRLSCVECTHYKYNWIKYIAVANIPLTLFLIVVITFRISATSGSMVGYVTVSQLGATYTLSKLYLAVSNHTKWAVLVRFLSFHLSSFLHSSSYVCITGCITGFHYSSLSHDNDTPYIWDSQLTWPLQPSHMVV